MSNITGHLDINRLRERAGQKPRTKVGQVRQVWPEIKSLLSAGHSLKDIWAWLNEIGLAIGYTHLSYCIAQFRLQDRTTHSPFHDFLGGLMPATAEHARQEQPTGQGELSPNDTPDPLRNIRERRARKSGFEYDPFPTKGLTE
jgi:hypothetical protein